MSSLLIVLFFIAALVSAPLLIVMLVVKLTEAEHQKKAREKIAEANRLVEENAVATVQLSASVQQMNVPDRNDSLSNPDGLADDQKPASDINTEYTPNHIPAGVRTESVVLSLFLIGYGTFGWYLDDMYLPSKRGGFHIQGLALQLMFCAMICAALNLAAVVIDHYDQRNNERHYIAFSKVTRSIGWTLFVLALAVDLFNYEQAQKIKSPSAPGNWATFTWQV